METENEVGVCVYCSAEKPLDDLLTTGRGNLACNNSSCVWTCNHCDNAFTHNRTKYQVQDDSDFYCRECLRDGDFYKCYHCDEWLHADDSYYMTCADVTVCDACRDCRYSWCDRCEEYYYGSHSHPSAYLHEYGNCPDVWEIKRVDDDDTSNILMGIEIETGSDLDDDVLGEHADHIGSRWGESELYITEDGSVDGFEIKTHPMTLTYAKEGHDWSWLTWLRGEGHAGWDETSAGIHVHVDRNAFDNSIHLMKFLMFIYGNSLDVSIFAGRVTDYATFSDRSNLSRKARTNRKIIHDEFGIVPNMWSQDRMYYGTFPADMIRFPEFFNRVKALAEDRGASVEHMIRVIERGISYQGTGTRNAAVNVTKENDVEIRLFRSSLRKERVLAIFEFVHSLIEYTRQINTRDVVKGSLKWDVYLQFMRENDQTYDNFARNIFHWTMEGVFDRATSELIALLNRRASLYDASVVLKDKSDYNKRAFTDHMFSLDRDENYYVHATTEQGF